MYDRLFREKAWVWVYPQKNISFMDGEVTKCDRNKQIISVITCQ